jgi:uncharacterized protein (TIGR03083 family)
MATVVLIPEIVAISRHTDASEVARAAYQQLFDLLEQLPASDWSAPTECAGWKVCDMVGHMIGAAEANASVRENVRQQLGGLRHRGEYGGNPLDATNARQISEHVTLSPTDRLIALRDAAPAAVKGRMRLPGVARAISVPLSSGGSTATGMPRRVNLGRLVDVIYTRDVWMHTIDIARAVNQPLDVTHPMNRRVVADVVAEWAHRHGQPIDLTLTGPAGGHYRSPGPNPITPIEHDAVDFCRIVSGRAAGDQLLGTRILF